MLAFAIAPSLNALFSGFYDTLDQSKARGAIWRVVGFVQLFRSLCTVTHRLSRQQIVFTQLNESGSCEFT